MIPWTMWAAILMAIVAVWVITLYFLDCECEDMRRRMEKDPVHFDAKERLWYFWDETWADRCGPFESEAEARRELEIYCEALDRAREEG